MSDVALIARVSPQTVSRVLNGHPNVRSATRTRVLAAVNQLGYRPNLVARALATGRARTLGLVTLNTTLYGPVATLYAVERAARNAGYGVGVTSVASVDERSLHESVAALTQQAVAGLIVIAPVTASAALSDAFPHELPTVMVGAPSAASVAAVTADHEAGAWLATRHLLELGHRTVFHVSGPRNWLEAEQRVSGWRAALAAAGAEVPDLYVGDWSTSSGYDAGLRLAANPAVTGVFAANDNMALGVLRAMHEHGRTVPDAVSIVGFDDIEEAAFFTPPLTTVSQDFSRVGRLCVELLLDQIDEGSTVPAQVVVAPALVVRGSTARPHRLLRGSRGRT